jgi:hypothetical protein
MQKARALSKVQLFVIMAGVLFSACYSQGEETTSTSQKTPVYNLFTWNVQSGDVCFALMKEADRSQFIHRWFPKRNARCGIPELKKALAALPKNSLVCWNDWPPKEMDYPPDNVVDEIQRFAKANGIRVELYPALG